MLKPPLEIGDVLSCYCGDMHALALFLPDGTPVVSCPEALIGPREFPALFYDGSILFIQRVPD